MINSANQNLVSGISKIRKNLLNVYLFGENRMCIFIKLVR
jgi:hypothetical protein